MVRLQLSHATSILHGFPTKCVVYIRTTDIHDSKNVIAISNISKSKDNLSHARTKKNDKL